MTTIVFVPGYGDSPPGHWQRDWFDAATGGDGRDGDSALWVVQPDWEAGPPQTWVDSLDAAVAATSGPLALVAHSLGVLTVVRWAAQASTGPEAATGRVVGALLVAAPDPESPAFPAHLGWGPAETQPLPFRSVLVSSSDDPYAAPARSRAFADAWGARLVEIGAAGHVNAASGYGPWPRGPQLLTELLN